MLQLLRDFVSQIQGCAPGPRWGLPSLGPLIDLRPPSQKS